MAKLSQSPSKIELDIVSFQSPATTKLHMERLSAAIVSGANLTKVKAPPAAKEKNMPWWSKELCLSDSKHGHFLKHSLEVNAFLMSLCTGAPSLTINVHCVRPSAKRGLTSASGRWLAIPLKPLNHSLGNPNPSLLL